MCLDLLDQLVPIKRLCTLVKVSSSWLLEKLKYMLFPAPQFSRGIVMSHSFAGILPAILEFLC